VSTYTHEQVIEVARLTVLALLDLADPVDEIAADEKQLTAIATSRTVEALLLSGVALPGERET
jgi:hypothetical protein